MNAQRNYPLKKPEQMKSGCLKYMWAILSSQGKYQEGNKEQATLRGVVIAMRNGGIMKQLRSPWLPRS